MTPLIKFLLSAGFTRRSQRSTFYDLHLNGTHYYYQRNVKGNVTVKNVTDGGAVTITGASPGFEELQFTLLLDFLDGFGELIAYLKTRSRLNLIDEILEDLV